jgi:general secretion pathway protein D
VAATLAPWVGGSALAFAHPETNALILAGSERKLHGLLAAARALDAAAEEQLLVRRLRHRSAAELAPILEGALAEPGTARPAARVVAVASSNAVVVRGAPEALAQAREWLARLDAAPESAGGLHVRRVRYADAEDLAVTLGEVARGAGQAVAAEGLVAGLAGRDVAVAVDHPTRSLLIRTDPETWGVVSALLDELDHPPPSIHVEAVLLEVLSSDALSLGFDGFVPFGDSFESGVGGVLLNPSGGGLFQPGAGAGPSLGARLTRAPTVIPIVGPGGEPISVIIPGESFVLTADEQVLASRVLMRPHLQMVSGDENEVFAGDNLPIPVASSTAAENPLQTQLDIERQDVGVSLRVRPSLGHAGRVRLEIELEASRLAAQPEPMGALVVGPTLEQRLIQTTVLVAPDEVVLIGGARMEGVDSTRVGTPWLHEVPALGALFRRTDRMRLERQLLLVVQARVTADADAQVAETIRRRLALERAVARVAPLAAGDEPRLAVRAASRERRGDADAIAADLARRGEPARVVAWEWEEQKRYDVVLDGYASVPDAAAAALRVRDAGFTPEVEVVPPRVR